jgi:flagellar biosynthesis/type III secretory pathway protein FliH
MEGDIKELKFKLDRSDDLIKILKKEVMPIQEAIAEHEADLQQLHQEEMDTVKQELYEKYQEEEGEKIEDLTQNYNEQISDLKEELESYEEDGSSWERIRDEMRDEVEKEMVGDLADHIEEYIRERKWS